MHTRTLMMRAAGLALIRSQIMAVRKKWPVCMHARCWSGVYTDGANMMMRARTEDKEGRGRMRHQGKSQAQ